MPDQINRSLIAARLAKAADSRLPETVAVATVAIEVTRSPARSSGRAPQACDALPFHMIRRRLMAVTGGHGGFLPSEINT
jgi:hypothetical protein